MIKILFFHHVSDIGGASWCLLELVKQLDRSEYEPIVVLRQRGPLDVELRRIGVQCLYMKTFGQMSQTYQMAFPFYGLRFFLELLRFIPAVVSAKKLISFVNPDIIYLNTSVHLPIAVAARRSGSARVIMHIREHWRCNSISLRRLIKNRIARTCVDHLFAITQTDADHFGFPERTRIVHDWPDFDTRGDKLDVYRELGIDKTSRILLVPGGNQSIKGTHIAVKAFSTLDRDNTVLVILAMKERMMKGWKRLLYGAILRPLGLRQYREELNRELHGCFGSNIKCCETVKTIKSYMEASTAVLCPFIVPHAAKAALEAGALGRIAVVSDNGEGREYVRHGETGLIVPAGDVEALVSAMRNILDDEKFCHRIGENARRYVTENFNQNDSMNNILSAIRELICNKEIQDVQK